MTTPLNNTTTHSRSRLCTDLNIDVPLIGGAMYPCSNPELVAAVSEAGALGVVQPMSLCYAHNHDFAEGIDLIRSMTKKPIGLNLILETSSKKYMERTRQWLDIAIEKDIRFFVTALGDPAWVVKRAQEHGIIVYHDVTNLRFAQKALDGGVDGFICVNNRAGGHAGNESPEALLDQLGSLGKPLVCAGGIGDPAAFRQALDLGYEGAQIGTRFIATTECSAHDDYKQAILQATEAQIVLTEKLTGVPVSVIETPYIKSIGTKAGSFARWMLNGKRTKHWMRTLYTIQSIWKLKKANVAGSAYKDYWQAGKSAGAIHQVKSVREIVQSFSDAL